MHERIVAYCGLVCSDCEAYIATRDNDIEALQNMAEATSKQFGVTMTIDDARCNGCLATEGYQCGYCTQCEVRICAVERGVANCAHCTDFGCETLAAFLAHAPKARQTLEAIRAAF